MKPELLPSLFDDIRDYGSVRIKKSKLLWMLGRFHETPSVYGMHWGDEITLAMARPHEIASDWTTRREKPDLPTLQLELVP